MADPNGYKRFIRDSALRAAARSEAALPNVVMNGKALENGIVGLLEKISMREPANEQVRLTDAAIVMDVVSQILLNMTEDQLARLRENKARLWSGLGSELRAAAAYVAPVSKGPLFCQMSGDN